jgi:hypothetical protein
MGPTEEASFTHTDPDGRTYRTHPPYESDEDDVSGQGGGVAEVTEIDRGDSNTHPGLARVVTAPHTLGGEPPDWLREHDNWLRQYDLTPARKDQLARPGGQSAEEHEAPRRQVKTSERSRRSADRCQRAADAVAGILVSDRVSLSPAERRELQDAVDTLMRQAGRFERGESR